MLPVATSTPPSLQITEIMYNPIGANTGRQWIEVRNTGAVAANLTAKSMRIVDAHGNHLIKAVSGSGMIAPGDVAVIAANADAFKSDWPSYSGNLLKSAFSLTAEGNISLMDGVQTIAGAAYSSSLGGANDGNSLQFSKGTFVAGRPTPGVYAVPPPAPLAAPVKPSAVKSGSSKQGATSPKVLTDTPYDPGITAPTTEANAPVVGALMGYVTGAAPLLSSVWFSVFLGVLAISAFSLILITRYT